VGSKYRRVGHCRSQSRSYGLLLFHRWPQIDMHKVIALGEQWFALLAGQSIGKAVAEVEVGGVAAAFAVVTIGSTGYFPLRGSNRLDGNVESLNQFIEFSAQNRISPPIHQK